MIGRERVLVPIGGEVAVGGEHGVADRAVDLLRDEEPVPRVLGRPVSVRLHGVAIFLCPALPGCIPRSVSSGED